MIKDSSFKALENELSVANIVFKNEGGLSTLQFNNFSNPNDFKVNLEILNANFSKELDLNLRGLGNSESRLHHLELVLRIFVCLQEKLGLNNTVLNCPVEISAKNQIDPICICSKMTDVPDLIAYFCFQKNTILESIRLIKTYRLKYRRNANEYWKDVFKDFYPYYCRLKEQLSEIHLIQDQIQFLKTQRNKLDLVFQEKEINLFNSPLNLFFEFRIDCLKDLLISSKLNTDSKPKSKEQTLKWSGKVAQFIELVLSLKLSSVIEFKDGGLISRKELFRHFELFFNLPHINDLDSRINKFKIRSNKSPFLDELKKNCVHYLNDE